MGKSRGDKNDWSVLFIGNSFTARNELPVLIAKMAAVKGNRIDHKLISAGGASLRTHWNGASARKEIASRRYDYVVLQEQSTLPIKNAQRFYQNARLFDEAIKEAGARTMLYMTWARLNAPESQAALTSAYTTIGRELGAIVVPVGVAWEKYLAKHQEPVLHDRDQSHPTLAGSFLAACVFFGTLFGENPTGYDCEVDGLDKEDRVRLEKSAWPVCKARK
jgi:hypothetical protein